MNKYRMHIRPAFLSALGYGLGFVAGVVVIQLILQIGFLESISQTLEDQHLLLGLLILFSVIFLGGALAGAIGGFALSHAIQSEYPKRTIARSAIGIGAGFVVVLLPITVLLSTLSMYNAGDTSLLGFLILMGLVGAVFGLVSGFMTGTVPARVNFWHITGVAMLAFGLGGIAFGLGLWNYFYLSYQGSTAVPALLLAFFIFGGMGGFVLGWIFSLDREKVQQEGGVQPPMRGNIFYRVAQWFKTTKFYRKRGFWGTFTFFLLLFVLSRIVALSPLNISSADISGFLPSNSIGVHWSDSKVVSSSQTAMKDVDISSLDGSLAVVWEEGGDVFLSTAEITNQRQMIWSSPINLSGTVETASTSPQAVVDNNERIHIVWSEQTSESGSSSMIFYRSCKDGQCTEAMTMPSDCASQKNITPSITANDTEVLVIWGKDTDQLSYSAWNLDETPASGSSGCFMFEGGTLSNPRLASRSTGEFALTFEDESDIYVSNITSPDNTFELIYKETGRLPEVLVDAQGDINVAWCGEDGTIYHRKAETQPTVVPGSNCLTRPAMGQDAEGILHLVWYGNQVEQGSGKTMQSDLIYESRLDENGWSAPVIVGFSAENAQPVVASGADGVLHLIWDTPSSQVYYANYRAYSCSAENLNPQVQLALDITQSGAYRPADDIVPYCDNQFDRLLILPQPDPAYSDIPPTTNGAFDQVAELIRSAKYEVLLSTMWYETDETGTSPGDVTAQAVKDLYDQVKAHPEQYPRGMTVRILLGNPPEFTLSNLVSQVWRVFNHMRSAGVPTMSDPEIGWRLEIANYQGSWPHSHSKMLVIDGKTAIAAGFNFQHKHQAVDHPSGQGKDDYDLGLQMTGPVAQDTQRYFDDLWGGANSIQCTDLNSDSSLWWLSCRRVTTTTDHVPEAQMYYLAPENHNAFALYRSQKFNESDVVVAKTVVSAQDSLDVLQVNFTLNMICDLNVLLPICDVSDSPKYMSALLDAIETNQVKIRILFKKKPIEVVENKIAMTEFLQALAERGLSDLVEFRYFNDSVHAKAVLIDDQFLIVGSQNFHYSAFGDGKGLVEFNIGTDDPDAIASFKSFFEYHWERGTPIPEE